MIELRGEDITQCNAFVYTAMQVRHCEYIPELVECTSPCSDLVGEVAERKLLIKHESPAVDEVDHLFFSHLSIIVHLGENNLNCIWQGK